MSPNAIIRLTGVKKAVMLLPISNSLGKLSFMESVIKALNP